MVDQSELLHGRGRTHIIRKCEQGFGIHGSTGAPLPEKNCRWQKKIEKYLKKKSSRKGKMGLRIVILFLRGCGMGPWLVFASPCFGENVVVTCKIGSFLCSLDNLLHKNVIVFFFGNQISKWRSFEKRAIFDLLFTFLVTRKKLQKFFQHIFHSHTYIHVFCSPY